MKKKIFCAVVLAVISAALYAQENEEKKAGNIIGLSAGLFGGELSYERVITPNFSVLGQISYNNWVLADSISFSAKARLYPSANTFFLDLGLGYSYGYNITEDAAKVFLDILLGIITLGLWFTTDEFQSHDFLNDLQREHGFLIQPGMGWNIDIGKKNHFMMPISLGLDIRVAKHTAVLPYFKFGFSYAF